MLQERRGVKTRRYTSNPYTFFLVPSVLVLILVYAGPLAYGGFLSFSEWVLYRQPTPQWAGFEQWNQLLSSGRFWHSIWIQVVFVGSAVTVEVTVGLAIALYISREIRGLSIVRSFFLFPLVLPPIVAAFLWRYMLQSDIGVVNYFLGFVGLARPWLSDAGTALFTLVVVDIWQYTPFAIVLLVAALQQLPPEVQEAARVDGAGNWQRFRHVTLPLIMPTILVVAVLRVIDAMKVFPTIYVLTQGGPGTATEALNYFGFHVAFDQSNMGLGATVSLAVTILSLTITFAFLWATRITRVEI